MHPNKVDRTQLQQLTDLPNVGGAVAKDLNDIGIERPEQLIGRDPRQLFEQLCDATGQRHDPCMLDTLMSIVSFMDGGRALPWWSFTAERKRLLQQ